jgi:hypothetical protein
MHSQHHWQQQQSYPGSGQMQHQQNFGGPQGQHGFVRKQQSAPTGMNQYNNNGSNSARRGG